MSEFKVGATAPPFHPWCRCCTAPYFADMGGVGRRFARDPDDEFTYTVPKDMTYKQWKEIQDGNVLDKSAESGIMNIVQEEMPRKVKKVSHAVDWKVVQTKEYSDKFKALSDNPSVSNAIEIRAKWALNNRDGVETEELYAINLFDGSEIGRIVDQHYTRGVKRTTSFSRSISNADARGEQILLIHNHPNNSPPSISDLNELLNSMNATGITVGHGGSVYYYSRPSRKIEDIDYYTKLRHFSNYRDEIVQMEKALESLQEKFGFVIKKL